LKLSNSSTIQESSLAGGRKKDGYRRLPLVNARQQELRDREKDVGYAGSVSRKDSAVIRPERQLNEKKSSLTQEGATNRKQTERYFVSLFLCKINLKKH